MQRKIVFSEGEYYHIYNRGVERRDIFMETRDKERFVKLLYVANGTKAFEFRQIQNQLMGEIDRDEPLVAIGAYVLMPNHFHILVKETRENGISTFMEKFGTAYSMYFNKKYKRSGFLFQGNFKAEHVDNDEYLKYLFAYIHLNPVKLIEPNWKETGIQDGERAKKYLADYQHSSYADYANGNAGEKRDEVAILTKEEFPEYFAHAHEFKDFVNDWLEFREEAHVAGRAFTKSLSQ